MSVYFIKLFIVPGESLLQDLWGHPVLPAEGLLQGHLAAGPLVGEVALPALGAAPLAGPIQRCPEGVEGALVHLEKITHLLFRNVRVIANLYAKYKC